MLWEFSIEVAPEGEPLLSDFLQDQGSMGVVVEDTGEIPLLTPGGRFQRCRIKGFFDETCDRPALESALLQLLAEQKDGGQPGEILWRELHEEDWQESWKQLNGPIAVGERLLVLPSWLPEPEDNQRLLLRIDPEMAFGSGSHETTRGCLLALEQAAAEAPLGRLLDMGTGSGILTIAAYRLGAEQIIATDLDPIAVETCQRNCLLNLGEEGLGEGEKGWISILLTDSVPATAPFQTIVANILASVLIQHAPALTRSLLPGGRLILSGLLVEQAEEVINHFHDLGFPLFQQEIWGEWVVLTTTKPVNF